MGISRDKKEAKARSFFWKTKMVFLFSAVGSIFGIAVAIFELGKKNDGIRHAEPGRGGHRFFQFVH